MKCKPDFLVSSGGLGETGKRPIFWTFPTVRHLHAEHSIDYCDHQHV